MTALLTPRFWIGLALVALLTFTHGFAYKTGRAAVRSAWDKERSEQMAAALVASEAARAKEQALITVNQKVTNELKAEKTKRAADAVVAAGRLREFEAALDRASSEDTPARPGTDDPAVGVARECARSLVLLDDYAANLASQTRGLQAYARDVCLSP